MSSRQMVSLRDRHVGAPLNIAIVGSGISGMAAAWLLSRRHRVTVFEKDGRLGGHSNTVQVQVGDRTIPVDTGFIVYNNANYPNLVALFDHLQVPTKPSSMSFSVSVGHGALEYSGTGLRGLLGQRRNLVRPRFWSMVQDILQFYREAPRDLSLGRLEGITLGEYVTAAGYSEAFVEDHLLPMAAAIWSSPLAAMRDHSAASIVRFFETHGLLRLEDRPQWRTVDGGSREYVRRLTAGYADRVRLRCGARKVLRRGRGVWIEAETGALSHFDHVVIATHADEALDLLDDPSPLEFELLGAIRYQANPAVLHQDESLMPRRKRVWSSWNYMRNDREHAGRSVYVTYWMNRLQGIDPAHPLFVTLNPPHEPAKGKMLGYFLYNHPLLDAAATRRSGCGICKAGAAPGSAARISARVSTRTVCRPASRWRSSWAARGGHGMCPANRTASISGLCIWRRRSERALRRNGDASALEAEAAPPALWRVRPAGRSGRAA